MHTIALDAPAWGGYQTVIYNSDYVLIYRGSKLVVRRADAEPEQYYVYPQYLKRGTDFLGLFTDNPITLEQLSRVIEYAINNKILIPEKTPSMGERCGRADTTCPRCGYSWASTMTVAPV